MVFEGRGTTQQKKPDLLSGPTGRNILPVHGSILRIEQLFDPEDRTMVDKKKIFLKGGVSLPARRARHNKKCKQKKVRFFCQTWTGREDHDNRFPFFETKRFAFFVNLGQEGYSWYPFP